MLARKGQSVTPIDYSIVLVYHLVRTLIQSYTGGGKIMEFNSNLPIYIQIMNMLKTKMASGELNGGDKLPSVREFSKEMKVNPNTIQRVYQELEREELVFTQRGMGTFVTENKDTIKGLKKGRATELMNLFFGEMSNLGFTIEEIKGMIMEWVEKEECK